MSTNWGLPDAAGSSSLPSGPTGAPTTPVRTRIPRRCSLPTEERADRRVVRCGMGTQVAGRRAAVTAAGAAPHGRRRRQPCSTDEHAGLGPALLLRRAQPPRRHGGRGKASLAPAMVGVCSSLLASVAPPHSLALVASLTGAGWDGNEHENFFAARV
jgi:hypothetical protein